MIGFPKYAKGNIQSTRQFRRHLLVALKWSTVYTVIIGYLALKMNALFAIISSSEVERGTEITLFHKISFYSSDRTQEVVGIDMFWIFIKFALLGVMLAVALLTIEYFRSRGFGSKLQSSRSGYNGNDMFAQRSNGRMAERKTPRPQNNMPQPDPSFRDQSNRPAKLRKKSLMRLDSEL